MSKTNALVKKQDLEDKFARLESPTSLKMKNAFILQNANQSFDEYFLQMKKKKFNMSPDKFTENDSHDIRNPEENGKHGTIFINRKQPSARDGHTCLFFGDKMIIFGGDRHHMPFNDLFIFDIKDFFFREWKMKEWLQEKYI